MALKRTVILFSIIGLILLSACIPRLKAPENYRGIYVGGLTVSIPANWTRGELPRDLVQKITESQGGMVMQIYNDKLGICGIGIMYFNIKLSYELEGRSWIDWENAEEVEGLDKKLVSMLFGGMLLTQITDMSSQEWNEKTIGSCDAWEMLCTARIGDIRAKCCYVTIFGEDDLGLVYFFVDENYWQTYNDCWIEIRDSLEFH
ncbi:MAG: hypothetical protein JSW16_06780 [Dehalococcoidales bacterium]|nr:MAG: hypothetical protein JSW16_06780 [Dehalococcoidales bacterium]